MGTRNPDRVPLHMRRAKCETVVQMIEQRWDVLSKCMSCSLIMQVDLRVIARVKGPTYSLWDRSARCKRLHCCGVVRFKAKSPDMSWHEHLRSFDRPESVPAWLENQTAKASKGPKR
ncbi:MAG: hypothetical protein Q8N10_03190 [Phenylobacterium sp.]|uniref:hypothetical protein n=1 Tax=Phenylobacterium sp. TaxID=1871053 RepID=UPI0027237E17|nr:hypothetical protein [Phenylobacterium sp.]MDO8912275.1 hypothetical protein [Phenylobacterium sp.]MDP3099487.1 hypothetical protein [Phenylobacterium sp.]